MDQILALTAEQSGQSFDVKPGVFVTITLPQNASTGYSWRDHSQPEEHGSHIVISVFRLLGSQYYDRADVQPGSWGIRVLAYQQTSIGPGSIRLELVAPDGTVAQELEFHFMATNA